MSRRTDVPTLTAASFDPKAFLEEVNAGKRISARPERSPSSELVDALPDANRPMTSDE
jgi:hypothetical protein